MNKLQYQPAKRKLLFSLLALAVILVFAFTFILRESLRTPAKINEKSYDIITPENFVWNCDINQQNGAIIIDGWAYISGERIVKINNFVVLRNIENNTYYRLPTKAIANSKANEEDGDGILYDRAGFTSITPVSKLNGYKYEICFAYCNNDSNYLIQTGSLLEVELK